MKWIQNRVAMSTKWQNFGVECNQLIPFSGSCTPSMWRCMQFINPPIIVEYFHQCFYSVGFEGFKIILLLSIKLLVMHFWFKLNYGCLRLIHIGYDLCMIMMVHAFHQIRNERGIFVPDWVFYRVFPRFNLNALCGCCIHAHYVYNCN